jgi:hypothetical protein
VEQKCVIYITATIRLIELSSDDDIVLEGGNKTSDSSGDEEGNTTLPPSSPTLGWMLNMLREGWKSVKSEIFGPGRVERYRRRTS